MRIIKPLYTQVAADIKVRAEQQRLDFQREEQKQQTREFKMELEAEQLKRKNDLAKLLGEVNSIGAAKK